MNSRPHVLTSKAFFSKADDDRDGMAIGYKPGGVEKNCEVDQVFRLIHDGAPDEVEERRAAVKAAGDDPDKPKLLLPYTISTENRDRDGDRIMVRGWRVKLYLATNPIVLFNHNAEQLPIGKSVRVWRQLAADDGPKLRAIAQFMPPEMDGGFSSTVFSMAKAGFLPASSVGFMPKVYEKDPLVEKMSDEERKQSVPWYGGLLHKETELLEWSPVMIPSNPYALNEARKLGINVSPWLEEAEKALAGEESKIKGWLRDEIAELFGFDRSEFAGRKGQTSSGLTTRGLLEESVMATKTSKTFTQPESRNPYEGTEDNDDGVNTGTARDPIHEGKSALELAEELAVTAKSTLEALNVAALAILEKQDSARAELEKAAEIINKALAETRDEEVDPETPAGPVEEPPTSEPAPRVKALSFLGGLLSTGS